MYFCDGRATEIQAMLQSLYFGRHPQERAAAAGVFLYFLFCWFNRMLSNEFEAGRMSAPADRHLRRTNASFRFMAEKMLEVLTPLLKEMR